MEEYHTAVQEEPDVCAEAYCTEDDEDGRIDGYLESDIAAYAGAARGGVYVDKFRRIRDDGRSWNWAAFLFAGKWLAYRRMYGMAALLEAVSVLTGVSITIALMRPFLAGEVAYGLLELISFGFSFLFCILMGITGDRLYWRRVRAALQRAGCHRRDAGPDAALTERLEQSGGTCIWAVILILAGSYLFQKLVIHQVLAFTLAMFS